MSRSLKKGPFVDVKLLKAIEAMNEANEKKVIKTWSRPSTHRWWVTQLQSMMEENMCLYMLQKTW